MLRGQQTIIVIDWSELKANGSWRLLRAGIPVGRTAISAPAESAIASGGPADPRDRCRLSGAVVSRCEGTGLELSAGDKCFAIWRVLFRMTLCWEGLKSGNGSKWTD